jgi:hypothetical protein
MRYLTPCSACRGIREPSAEDLDDLDSDEAETETEATKFSEEDSNMEADDEGFFDRPAVSPESRSSTPGSMTIAT